MEPKEKAKELIDKFIPYVDSISPINYSTDYRFAIRNAKNCALITTNVILIDCGAEDWLGDEACEGKNYWQEVKTEIENYK